MGTGDTAAIQNYRFMTSDPTEMSTDWAPIWFLIAMAGKMVGCQQLTRPFFM